ncbi:YaaC family protein [Streptomyces sp. HUAS TT7]|uniref:YaaC family protein n=1 Tax=Streptomyces sp. HUAS TT7 TaxID=3447507 RepID=UPI003F65695C
METILGTPYREGIHYVLPALQGNQRPLHPLLTWWGVLYALASIARYEPQSWAKSINVDKRNDRIANAIEHLLEMALSAIPELVTRELHRMDRQSLTRRGGPPAPRGPPLGHRLLPIGSSQ